MRKTKWQKLCELHCEAHSEDEGRNIIASALYISAYGTNHFYEAMEILAKPLPGYYGDEFEKYKKKKESEV